MNDINCASPCTYLVAEPQLLLAYHEILKPIEVAAKYWPGVSYTAAIGEANSFAPYQLESVIVGKQEHSIAPSLKPIIGTGKILHSDAAIEVAKKHNKRGPAQQVAYDLAKKRVSRRLLLAERAKYLTVSCPITGIVSLMQIPAIPYNSLIWDSPLSSLENCRGIAQQSKQYLFNLDTQVLAGVLIVLADSYELFRFQPYDSGPQKNAILRTGGKENIIDAIIMIESLIHSANCSYLPKLSLVFDSNLEEFGLAVRLRSYLSLLAAAIEKPDKIAYDENQKPRKIGRPLYIKDVEKKEAKISFLARKELATAEKDFKEDKKIGKTAILELTKLGLINIKFKAMLLGVVHEDSILVIPSEMIGLICMKLESVDSNYARSLIEILKKDRTILSSDISEIEEVIVNRETNIVEEQNEKILVDDEVEEITGILSNYVETDPVEIVDSEVTLHTIVQKIEEQESVTELNVVPEYPQRSFIARMIAKKKLEAANKTRTFVTNDIPSVAVYKPSANKTKMGE